jgi:hypothetical protein
VNEAHLGTFCLFRVNNNTIILISAFTKKIDPE